MSPALIVSAGVPYMTDRHRHLIEGQRAEAADAFDAFLSSRTGTQTGMQAPALAVAPHA